MLTCGGVKVLRHRGAEVWGIRVLRQVQGAKVRKCEGADVGSQGAGVLAVGSWGVEARGY